ncbi:MAG: hypothetical protein IJ916_02670 [Paludibacteraceae bacterium]|nr:hypothetical protein [Paludibacteraceae bacterium]
MGLCVEKAWDKDLHDGKGRSKGKIWTERFWRTIKNEYVYYHPYDDGLKMREGIRWYIDNTTTTIVEFINA